MRDGSGMQVGELLHLTLPGASAAIVPNALGAVGLLNDLGGDGWEAVSEEWTSQFERIVLLKRKVKE